MRWKRSLFCITFFILIISSLTFVSSEILISDAGVQYDSSIVGRFENGSNSVLVWVKTKNSSPQEIFDILGSNEITLRTGHLFDNGFEGNVTNEGFDKLINNSGVSEIYDMTTAYPSGAVGSNNSSLNFTGDESKNETSKQNVTLSEAINGTNKTSFIKNYFWILGIILLVVVLFIIIKSIIKKRTENGS